MSIAYLVYATRSCPGDPPPAVSVLQYGGMANALRDHCLLSYSGLPVPHEEFISRNMFPGFVIHPSIELYAVSSWQDFWEMRRLFIRLYTPPIEGGGEYFFLSHLELCGGQPPQPAKAVEVSKRRGANKKKRALPDTREERVAQQQGVGVVEGTDVALLPVPLPPP